MIFVDVENYIYIWRYEGCSLVKGRTWTEKGGDITHGYMQFVNEVIECSYTTRVGTYQTCLPLILLLVCTGNRSVLRIFASIIILIMGNIYSGWKVNYQVPVIKVGMVEIFHLFFHCTNQSSMFTCQIWHILETIFYQYWHILACQFWN